MTFRVGQKVVCVDASNCTLVEEGRIYTVTDVGPFLEVDCPPSSRGCRRYFPRRFRPLVERKTDIAIFNEILRKVSGKRRVEA